MDPNEKLNINEQHSIVLNSSLTLPKTIIKLPTKSYNLRRLNDPSIIKNNTHVDFNEKNLDNVRLVKVNSMPEVGEHLTAKYYDDNASSYRVDESSLLRLDPQEKLKLDEQDSIFRNSIWTSPKTIIELPTKSYVDSLHESNKNGRNLWSVSIDQDIEFNNSNFTKLDSVVIYRNPNSDNELSNKKYIDDELDKNTIFRFNSTLENYLKVSVGKNAYKLTKYDKIQTTETTIIKYPNTGSYFLQNWVIRCNEKNINDKMEKFIKSIKTNNPTGYSGADSLPPIGNSFMYIETSSNNHGN